MFKIAPKAQLRLGILRLVNIAAKLGLTGFEGRMLESERGKKGKGKETVKRGPNPPQ